MGKYMSHNLRDHLRDYLLILEKGAITIVEYVDQFQELERHYTSIMTIKLERVHCAVK